MNLGKKLKTLRNQKGLSLEELSTSLNNSIASDEKGIISFNKGKLSKWENNKEEPKLSALKYVADFFNVPIDDIMGNNDILLYQNNNQGNISNNIGGEITEITGDKNSNNTTHTTNYYQITEAASDPLPTKSLATIDSKEYFFRLLDLVRTMDDEKLLKLIEYAEFINKK